MKIRIPHSPPHSDDREAGSALFLIFIGVVLFAGLSFTVAQIMRSGDPNMIGEERAKLLADEIVTYGRALRQAAQGVKIANGCADTDISFENTILSGYTHTPPAPDTCRIFDAAGGGMNYVAPADDALDTRLAPAPALRGDWYAPANICVDGVGTAPAGGGCGSDSTDNESLIAVLPYVRRQVCLEINTLLGVTNPGGDPPIETGNAWDSGLPKYEGVYADGEQIDQTGKMAGCFEGAAASTPATGSYHFFQVLVAR